MKACDLQAIERWAADLDGVFDIADLKVLFREQTESALYKKLEAFLGEGLLIKVRRGLYACPDASLARITARLCPESYISLGTVLARATVIGSVPVRRVQAVKTGRPRTFTCKLGTLQYLSVAPRLFFGFTEDDGVRYATPEKAYVDACYYAYRGRQLSFDLDSDVATERLDRTLIERYLAAYDNRAADFVRGMLGE